jgi:hypothetical protein
MEGRLDEAERLAADSAVMRGWMETADAESVFAAQLFMIRMQQGRLHELVDAAEHFMDEYPALDPWRAALPLAYIAAGRGTLEPYAGCIVQVGYAGCLGPVARLLGLLAAARGDREAAATHLEAAVAISQATGLRLFETQARAELEELATPSG